MRVLVFGSRTFSDENAVWDFLTGLYQTHSCGWMTVSLDPFTVISGMAPGADTFGVTWVENCPLHGPPLGQPNPFVACPVELLKFPADWELYGKAAGPIRNQQMLVEGKPTFAVGFVDKPLVESRGSHDMAKRLKNARVHTYVVELWS
jgi:hypothetical protein